MHECVYRPVAVMQTSLGSALTVKGFVRIFPQTLFHEVHTLCIRPTFTSKVQIRKKIRLKHFGTLRIIVNRMYHPSRSCVHTFIEYPWRLPWLQNTFNQFFNVNVLVFSLEKTKSIEQSHLKNSEETEYILKIKKFQDKSFFSIIRTNFRI